MVLCPRTVRFGDIEEVVRFARSVRLGGLGWLSGPILRLAHGRRLAKLGLLRHRGTMLLIRPPRSQGLFRCVAFSSHICGLGLIEDLQFERKGQVDR